LHILLHSSRMGLHLFLSKRARRQQHRVGRRGFSRFSPASGRMEMPRHTTSEARSSHQRFLPGRPSITAGDLCGTGAQDAGAGSEARCVSRSRCCISPSRTDGRELSWLRRRQPGLRADVAMEKGGPLPCGARAIVTRSCERRSTIAECVPSRLVCVPSNVYLAESLIARPRGGHSR